MPQYLRRSVIVVAALLLLAFFFALFATISVRSAIANGALENPAYGCLHPRDMGKLKAGPNQQLADWWLDHQIRLHNGKGSARNWHFRGAITNIGLAISTTPQERIDLAYASMKRLPLCN